MDDVVKKIIESKLSKEDKFQSLKRLSDDIEIAHNILSNKFAYCAECDDYYLAQSFLTDTKTEKIQIPLYSDPISGCNEYTDVFADATYSICPKGHRKQITKSGGIWGRRVNG